MCWLYRSLDSSGQMVKIYCIIWIWRDRIYVCCSVPHYTTSICLNLWKLILMSAHCIYISKVIEGKTTEVSSHFWRLKNFQRLKNYLSILKLCYWPKFYFKRISGSSWNQQIISVKPYSYPYLGLRRKTHVQGQVLQLGISVGCETYDLFQEAITFKLN